MIALYGVGQIRDAEEDAFRQVPDGTLMQRAAHALAIACARLLTDSRGGVVGTRTVLLVGSGNNGGDALWAGAQLAARGSRVDAVCLSDRVHPDGAAALRRAGGRLHRWQDGDVEIIGLVRAADLVVDGILGIGGTGGLRPDADALVAHLDESDAVVVSVDVPSGVDADTGGVHGSAVAADVTITFGAAKPGLVVEPGSLHSGAVQLVDIGLDLPADPVALVLEAGDVEEWVRPPAEDTYKYRRGVAGVAAGSRLYPGAALLVTAAARHANVGMTRYLDRGDGNAAVVLSHFPDVVADGAPPADQARATAWGCGPGFPGDAQDVLAVAAVLEAPVPVVLDAGALTALAESDELRSSIRSRAERGLVTVLTPHQGEFERLAPGLLASSTGRVDAARRASADLKAVVVLKGPGTVIAAPHGDVYVDVEGTADLGVAGSGDVLTGIIAAVLASAWADDRRDPESLTEAVAAAVWLHGRAGQLAGGDGPVTALDIADSVAAAIGSVRREAP